MPLPSFKSLRCLRCGMMVGGTDEEKRSELMKRDSKGGEGEGTLIYFLLGLYMSGKG